MGPRELCLGLLAAPTEDHAIGVLEQAGLWTDAKAWRDFNGQENNFSTIGNQQANPEAALVEKLINSIDAVLTLQCRLAGIDPEDSVRAPHSIKEAVSKFFGIRDGNLGELTGTELSTLAGRVGLIASGSKRMPNLTVIDLGEGQAPDDFPSTFLSLGASNKLKIPFVQGKFNMGGTGVLQFCGRRNLQLIMSKRHPELAPQSGDWGFTVVRREDPAGSRRSSVYRYLAPSSKIARFDEQGDLELTLDSTASGGTQLPSLPYGTIIKLFDYHLPGGAKTNILFDLFNHLSCLMPGIALPVRFYERRNYGGHSLESTLVGLAARLGRDTHDNLEFEPTSHEFIVDELPLDAKVYAFKRKPDGSSGSAKFREREGVIFLVNGQAHGFLDKVFFKRKRVNLSYIAEDILVLVDASRIPGRAREDLFMNSRDRLRDSDMRRLIETHLERIVGDHALLKALQQRRRQDALSRKLHDDKALEDVLRRLIAKSPSLASLFMTGQRLADPFSGQAGADDPLEFEGKRFPTFFRIMKGQERRQAHLGQDCRVQFETDAENQYFARDVEPGTMELWLDDVPYTVRRPNLLNGVGTLTLGLPDTAAVDQTVIWDGRVTDNSRFESFDFQFERQVAPAVESNGPGGRRKPPAKPEPGGREVPRALDLPPITSVAKPDWPRYGFDRESALAVRRNPEGGYDFYVNIDNVHLRWEAKNQPPKSGAFEAQFKYALALVGLGLLKWLESDDEPDHDVEERIGSITRAIAPILLPMISGLADLEDEVAAEADVSEGEAEEDPA